MVILITHTHTHNKEPLEMKRLFSLLCSVKKRKHMIKEKTMYRKTILYKKYENLKKKFIN